jgi:hypothetical protein
MPAALDAFVAACYVLANAASNCQQQHNVNSPTSSTAARQALPGPKETAETQHQRGYVMMVSCAACLLEADTTPASAQHVA